jgi:hypothetical protein
MEGLGMRPDSYMLPQVTARLLEHHLPAAAAVSSGSGRR